MGVSMGPNGNLGAKGGYASESGKVRVDGMDKLVTTCHIYARGTGHWQSVSD